MTTFIDVRGGRKVRGAWTAALVSLLAGGTAAWGQAQEPMDVNAVQPAAPAAPAAAAQPEGAAGDAAAASGGAQPEATATDDGSVYPVSKFLIDYASAHPNQPSVDSLMSAEVELAVLPGGYAKPGEGRSTVKMRLRDLAEGGGGNFYWSGLAAVGGAIVREMNAQGVIACYVMLPDLSTDTSHRDMREGVTEMKLVVVAGVIAENGVRTIARGDRLESAEEKVNAMDPVHDRIRRQSPLAGGDLINSRRLDDYLFALNRHPGRRVDAALAPGEKDGEVNLDYLVAENKPWSLYAQISNTGTEATSVLRERFGFVHNQLTGNDDILRVDYITGNFDASHAVTASYQFPVISDRVWIKPYASWSMFDASELGQDDFSEFSGESTTLGAEIAGNVFQHKNLFVDVFGGVRWLDTSIEQTQPISVEGEGQFLLPYIGVRAERFTEEMTTLGSISIETNINEWVDEEADRDLLGRARVDEFWTLFKWEFEHSFFLEPLLNGAGWRGESSEGAKSLAHEIAITFRGQYSPGERLPPMEQEVAGGFFSVRGYPESATAGDTVLIGSIEYRFHVPRALEISDPGSIGKRQMGMFGQDFRWAPQTEFGRTDWDLILRGFLDTASVYTAKRQVGEDAYDTLVGAGVGIELQVKRNFTARLDWGLVLNPVDETESNYDDGDTEVHLSATVLY